MMRLLFSLRLLEMEKALSFLYAAAHDIEILQTAVEQDGLAI